MRHARGAVVFAFLLSPCVPALLTDRAQHVLAGVVRGHAYPGSGHRITYDPCGSSHIIGRCRLPLPRLSMLFSLVARGPLAGFPPPALLPCGCCHAPVSSVFGCVACPCVCGRCCVVVFVFCARCSLYASAGRVCCRCTSSSLVRLRRRSSDQLLLRLS